MIDCPCYQCENRTETCHDRCELYIAWCDERIRKKQEMSYSGEELIRRYEINKMRARKRRYGK